MSALAICASAAFGDCREPSMASIISGVSRAHELAIVCSACSASVRAPALRGLERGPHQLQQRRDARADADGAHRFGLLEVVEQIAEPLGVAQRRRAASRGRDRRAPPNRPAGTSAMMRSHCGLVRRRRARAALRRSRSRGSRNATGRCPAQALPMPPSAMRSSGARDSSRSRARQSSASASR